MLSANLDLQPKYIIQICKQVEEKGLSGIWFGETTLRDAGILATIAALNTRFAQIGTSIVNVYTRSPGQLAMMGCTLNEISEGRFTLGLGVSTPAIVSNWHGIEYGNPLKRLIETLEILKLYFSGEKFEFKGKYFTIKNARLRLKSKPKLALAALNNTMIKIATRYADRIILNLYSVRLIKEAIKVVEEESRKIGKVRPTLSVMLYTYLLGTQEKDYEAAKELIAFYGSSEAYSKLFSRAGFKEEARNMLRAWELGNKDMVKKSISDKMIRELLAFGEKKELIERIKQYHESGVEDVFIAPFPFGDVQSNIKVILDSI